MKPLRAYSASPRVVIGVLVLASLLLAACGGIAGESWAGISSSPDGESIYVAFNRRIVSIDTIDGAIQWEYPDKDNQDAMLFAVPLIDNGTMYIGDYKGRLHAIGIDGTPRWVYEPEKSTLIGPLSTTATDRVISGVAVDSNLVYFGLGSRNVMAISRENATEAWTFETGHGVWATPLYLPADPEDADSVARLVVVSLDHRLYVLNARTGEELWRLNLGGAAPGNMVYDEERHQIYVGTFLSELLAIDLDTRTIASRFSTEGWLWGSPAQDGDVLYFGDLMGYLYAVRLTDNGFEQVWKRKVAEDAIRATPLVTETAVFVGSQDKNVYALSKSDGAAIWTRRTKGEVLTELLLAPGNPDDELPSDLVVVGTSDREELLIAFKITTGEVAWQYSDKN